MKIGPDRVKFGRKRRDFYVRCNHYQHPFMSYLRDDYILRGRYIHGGCTHLYRFERKKKRTHRNSFIPTEISLFHIKFMDV